MRTAAHCTIHSDENLDFLGVHLDDIVIMPQEAQNSPETIPEEQVFCDPEFPLGVGRYREQPDMERHRHEFSEIVIVMGGRGLHLTKQEDYKIEAGDVFVINDNQAHGYKNTDRLDIINIYFDFARLKIPVHDLREILGFNVLFTLEPQHREQHHFRSRLKLPSDVMAMLQIRVGYLEDELTARRPGFRLVAISVFVAIIAFLSRAYNNAPSPMSRRLLRLNKAIRYIENHYSEAISVDQLADLSDMSVSTLERGFRRSMGCTPIHYLLRFRLAKAAELLCDSPMSITKIAGHVGFDDGNYFTKQFKKVIGVTPRQYRRRTENDISETVNLPYNK